MKGSPTPGNWLTPLQDPVNDFVPYIFYWAFGLGIISLSMIHGRRLLQRASGWHNSLAFFLAMLGMIVFGYMSNVGMPNRHGGFYGPRDGYIAYNSLFDGLLVNLDSAMFALLAFYIASAAYRAFRVRTVEAGLLMVSALLVMLGLVNFGVWLTSAIPVQFRLGLFPHRESVPLGYELAEYAREARGHHRRRHRGTGHGHSPLAQSGARILLLTGLINMERFFHRSAITRPALDLPGAGSDAHRGDSLHPSGESRGNEAGAGLLQYRRRACCRARAGARSCWWIRSFPPAH